MSTETSIIYYVGHRGPGARGIWSQHDDLGAAEQSAREAARAGYPVRVWAERGGRQVPIGVGYAAQPGLHADYERLRAIGTGYTMELYDPMAALRELRGVVGHHYSEGDRVEGGDTAEDYDTGRVIAVDGSDVTVAWDGSLVTTTQRAGALRPEGERPVAREEG